MNRTLKRWKTRLLSCVFVTALTTLFLTSPVAQAAGLICGAWSVVTSPNVGKSYPQLYAVTAVSSSDVWAVGSTAFGRYTLTEHWNGTSWSVIPSPSPESGDDNTLYGVAAASTNDVWAVGTTNGTLIEHWNGTNWNVIASPSPGSTIHLSGAAVVSANDVWAVGVYFNSSSRIYQTLIEHWNGTTWSVVKGPSPGVGTLSAVAVVSTSDVWAVGESRSRALIEHWNGTTWSVVTSPNPQGSNLSGAAVVSASDVWTVGSKGSQTLTEHWNGTNWSIVTSPNPARENGLRGVTSVPATSQLWAVGFSFYNGGHWHTLTEFYC